MNLDFVRENLLLIEGLILVLVALTYWLSDKTSKFFDKLLTMLMLVLVAGTPIVYTSVTRSVFEVNKLLLLRLVLILGYGIWATRNILLSTQCEPEDETAVRKGNSPLIKGAVFLSGVSLLFAIVLPLSIGWMIAGGAVLIAVLTVYGAFVERWKWSGLELPFLVWLVVNALATIVSRTPEVSIIGAYDRWEGIVTVVNYVMLVWMFAQLVRTKEILYWVLGGLLVPTTLSAVYGIFQSFGIDFMRWSVDPTSRVFASINNPVHFSAYVGMLVPVGLGFLLHLTSLKAENERQETRYRLLKWVIFVSTFLCYYALYLSFSRAATLGFTASITVFYLFAFDLFSRKNRRIFLLDFLFSGLFIAFFYMDYIFVYFRHASLGLYVSLLTGLFFLVYLLFQTVWLNEENTGQRLHSFIAGLLLLAAFFLDDRFVYSSGIIESVGTIILTLGAVAYVWKLYSAYGSKGVRLPLKLTVVYLFAKLQFVILSWTAIGIYLLVMTAIYFLVQAKESLNVKRSVAFLSTVVFLPLLISLIIERLFVNTLVMSAEAGILIMNMVFLAVVSLYLFSYMKDNLQNEKTNMLVSFMLLFAVIVFVPSFSDKVSSLLEHKDAAEFRAAQNAEGKVGSYESVAIQGTARTSMWKTSLGWVGAPYPYFSEKNGKFALFLHPTAWVDGEDYQKKIKSYPLLGTGPDTVKEMYPDYRRDDYGRLEGGHNFTPDRVHNEYLNTAITTGVLGFAVRWFWVIGGFFFIVLGAMYRSYNKPIFFILVGTVTGMMVHLGQLNFNFSVVATAVLFYVLMGLALAISIHRIGEQEEQLPEPEEQVSKAKIKKALRKQSALSTIFQVPLDTSRVSSSDWIKIGAVWVIAGLFVWQAVLPFLAERHYREGYNAFVQKQWKTSIFELDEACRYAPWETQYRVQLGKAYEELANVVTNKTEKLNNYKKAEQEYEKILKISPNNPWYLNRLANVYLQYYNLYQDPQERKKYIEDAEMLLKNAAEADRNNPLFHMSYGYFLHRIGKYEEAMAEYQRVLQIDDRMNEARFNMAEIFFKVRNDVTAAIQAYEEIRERDENFQNLHESLGMIYFNQQDYEKALKALEKAVVLNPRSPIALRNLGATYHHMKKWDKAVAAYKRALRLNPNDYQTMQYLAHAYYNNGDIKEAIDILQEVAKKMPGDQVVRRNLSGMQQQLQQAGAK